MAESSPSWVLPHGDKRGPLVTSPVVTLARMRRSLCKATEQLLFLFVRQLRLTKLHVSVRWQTTTTRGNVFRPICSQWKESPITQPVHVHHRTLKNPTFRTPLCSRVCQEHNDYNCIEQQLLLRTVAVFIIISCICLVFICMYL